MRKLPKETKKPDYNELHENFNTAIIPKTVKKNASEEKTSIPDHHGSLQNKNRSYQNFRELR